MNTLLNDAANSVSGGLLLGIMTVVFLAFFLGWVWYAYSPANREHMEEMGKMPLGDGGEA